MTHKEHIMRLVEHFISLEWKYYMGVDTKVPKAISISTLISILKISSVEICLAPTGHKSQK